MSTIFCTKVDHCHKMTAETKQNPGVLYDIFICRQFLKNHVRVLQMYKDLPDLRQRTKSDNSDRGTGKAFESFRPSDPKFF